MTASNLTSALLLQNLGVSVADEAAANTVLRGTLAGVLPEPSDLIQTIGLSDEVQSHYAQFVEGGEPSAELLQALHAKSDALKLIISGHAPAEAVSPQEGPAGLSAAEEVERSSLVPVRIGPLRNPGLKMPMPEGGFGLVLADFDKTLFGGDSHLRLVSLGLRTRFDELRKVDNPVNRLIETMKMTYRYKTHQLDPDSAAGAVATLLDEIPVLQVARDWADAGARNGLKRGVLRLVHEQAREIVRAEVDEMVKQGKMAEPLSEEDLEEEAKTRIFVLSSQFANVLRMLTNVGPEHENLLGFNVENIMGSTGTFTPEGNFVDDANFRYCFDENKPKMAEEEFERRKIDYNPKMSRTFSDDVWYDRFLLAMAHNPENRFIIDPDRRDADYARHQGTQVVYDQWDLGYRAKWVAGLKGRRKRKLEVLQDQRFYPDSRAVTSMSDVWSRALFGAAEMIPLAVTEGALHGIYGAQVHPAAVAIPIGAGLLYGPLNRSTLSNVVVGATVAAGMAAAHADHSHFLPVAAALIGGLSMSLGQGLVQSLMHKGSAEELGHNGFKPQTRLMSFFGRATVTGAWFAAMRLLGLG